MRLPVSKLVRIWHQDYSTCFRIVSAAVRRVRTSASAARMEESAVAVADSAATALAAI